MVENRHVTVSAITQLLYMAGKPARGLRKIQDLATFSVVQVRF